jgi:hypothetical protein
MSPTPLVEPDLGRLERLGRGGTATVYLVPDLELPGHPGERWVYKQYNERTKERAGPALRYGLDALVSFRDRLPQQQRARWDERAIWPAAVVVDPAGDALGFVMRVIPDRFFQEFTKRAGGAVRRPREFDTLFGEAADAERVGLPEVSREVRLRLLTSTAGAYAMMHQQGVVLGDISGRNVLYDPGPAKPAIVLVDMDGVRISGTRSLHGAQPHTPYWEPPEARAAWRRLGSAGPGLSSAERRQQENIWAVQSKATDVYKFALLVIRVLDPGRGHAINVDPGRARPVLRDLRGPAAVTLLDQSIDADPAARPAMRDWYRTLLGQLPPLPAGPPRPKTGDDRALLTGRQVGPWTWVDGRGWVRQRP